MDSNFKQKQYFDLRNEITKKVDRIETLSTFCITSSIAVIGFIIEHKAESILFFLLIPFILICSYRVLINRKEIMGISEFIVGNHMEEEGYKWEENCSKRRKENSFSFKYLEFVAMMLASYIAYLTYIESKEADSITLWINVIWILAIAGEIAITWFTSEVKILSKMNKKRKQKKRKLVKK